MKKFTTLTCALLCVVLILLSGCSANNSVTANSGAASATSVTDRNETDYTLDQVVILSRHNIRSPLSDEGSVLASVTPNKWFDWTSGKSELSLRGGVLETEMGQYFRKYLVSKEFMPENWEPTDREVRIYSNSLQRTIATANYFKSAFLPVKNIKTEYHETIGEMDPVFNPQFTFMSEAFKKQALSEIEKMGGDKGLAGITEKLSENYKTLEKVIDFENSQYAKDNNITSFDLDAPEIKFEIYKEPYMEGTLDLTHSISDALVLQNYEESGSIDGSFGTELTFEQWKQIAEITDVYERTLFATPSISVNVANPMLKEMKNELNKQGRKVSYLCGHDSNILTVLVALGVEQYNLPGAISLDTPIGCKLVIQKWTGKDQKTYASVDLIYQNVEQLQKCTMLDMNSPPVVYSLSFKGIEKNADGFYKYDDLIALFDKAIKAYDNLPKD